MDTWDISGSYRINKVYHDKHPPPCMKHRCFRVMIRAGFGKLEVTESVKHALLCVPKYFTVRCGGISVTVKARLKFLCHVKQTSISTTWWEEKKPRSHVDQSSDTNLTVDFKVRCNFFPNWLEGSSKTCRFLLPQNNLKYLYFYIWSLNFHDKCLSWSLNMMININITLIYIRVVVSNKSRRFCSMFLVFFGQKLRDKRFSQTELHFSTFLGDIFKQGCNELRELCLTETEFLHRCWRCYGFNLEKLLL